VELLRTYSSNPQQDISAFLDAIALNWLIAGTDAHAKNYAILIGAAAQIRLAPLYDIASVLAYKDFDPQRLRLAMKLGGEYRLRNIGRRQWQKLAKEVRLNPEQVVEKAARLAAELPERAADVRQRLRQEGLKHPILDKLVEGLTNRAGQCRKLIGL
jgi:serine/threonine-protein kinase HipA